MYQRLFQQPVVEIDQVIASYSWFEFALNQDLVEKNILRLRHDPESLPTKFDLINEFLEQAELILDNIELKARFDRLIDMTIQFIYGLKVSVTEIETHLVLLRQWLLVNGIMNQQEKRKDKQEDTFLSFFQQRWMLRFLLQQNGRSNDTESSAVVDEHLSICRMIQQHLPTSAKIAEDLNLTIKTPDMLNATERAEMLFELGEYYFSIQQYDQSHTFFDQARGISSPAAIKSLEGYLAACESMATFRTDGTRSIEEELESHWKTGEFSKVVELFKENSITAERTITSTYRLELEQKALRKCQESKTRAARHVYMKIKLINAFEKLVKQETVFHLEAWICIALEIQTTRTEDDDERLSQQCFIRELTEILKVKLLPHSTKQLDSISQLNEQQMLPKQDRQTSELLSSYQMRYFDSLKLPSILPNQNISLTQKLEAVLALGTLDGSIFDQVNDLFSSAFDSGKWQELQSMFTLFQNSTMYKEKGSSIKMLSMLELRVKIGCLMQDIVRWKESSKLKLLSSQSSLSQALTPDFNSIQICAQLKAIVLQYTRVRLANVQNDENSQNDDDDCASWLGCASPVVLETLASLCAGALYRGHVLNIYCKMWSTMDLAAYHEMAILLSAGFCSSSSPTTTQSSSLEEDTHGDAPECLVESKLVDHMDELCHMTLRLVQRLTQICPRESRWRCALGDLILNSPASITNAMFRLQSRHNHLRYVLALRQYLITSCLTTRHVQDNPDKLMIEDALDAGIIARMICCFVQMGASIEAVILCQCYGSKYLKKGIEILKHSSPDQHHVHYFEFIWEMSFLEILIHQHQHEDRSVKVLTQIIQSPELNVSNLPFIKVKMEKRILNSFFRQLCQEYFISP